MSSRETIRTTRFVIRLMIAGVMLLAEIAGLLMSYCGLLAVERTDYGTIRIIDRSSSAIDICLTLVGFAGVLLFIFSLKEHAEERKQQSDATGTSSS